MKLIRTHLLFLIFSLCAFALCGGTSLLYADTAESSTAEMAKASVTDAEIKAKVGEAFVLPSLEDALKKDKKEMKHSKPVPYEPEEFAPSLRKLRRAETIFFGSLPLSFLFVSLGHDGYRSIKKIDSPLETKDWLIRFSVSAGISASVALIDYVLGEL